LPLKPTKVRKILKALAQAGFRLERTHGSHLVFKHPDGRMTVIPRHGNEELGRGLLRKIAMDLRVTPEGLAKLLDEA
jgi:predicted RNA binding protein YcfA (HicA-like mRNA interferase family)